jgi:hypothetical protein
MDEAEAAAAAVLELPDRECALRLVDRVDL